MATSSASSRTPEPSRPARSAVRLEEPAPPRSRSQRTADTLERLRGDVDLWVASASADGEAYLVPLSYHWDGSTLTIATPTATNAHCPAYARARPPMSASTALTFTSALHSAATLTRKVATAG